MFFHRAILVRRAGVYFRLFSGQVGSLFSWECSLVIIIIMSLTCLSRRACACMLVLEPSTRPMIAPLPVPAHEPPRTHTRNTYRHLLLLLVPLEVLTLRVVVIIFRRNTRWYAVILLQPWRIDPIYRMCWSCVRIN